MEKGLIRGKLEAQGYVDGKLVKKDRWVNFPLTDKELMDEIMRCVEDTDEVKLPVFAKRMVRFVEWDVPSFIEDEFSSEEDEVWALNLDKVNKTAAQFENITSENLGIVEALLDHDYELEEALRIVREEDYTDFRCDEKEDIVKHFAEKECRYIPDYIMDNVDYDSAFDDLKDDCCGTFIDTDEGWIYIDE